MQPNNKKELVYSDTNSISELFSQSESNFIPKPNTSQILIELGSNRANGDHINTVYDPLADLCSFVVFDKTRNYSLSNIYTDYASGSKLFPSVSSSVKTGAILLPKQVGEPCDVQELRSSIQKFINKHLDVDEVSLQLLSDYVLMSYVFECFEKIGYLRFFGPTNTGKSRALRVMFSLCYNSINLGVAPTTASIYRMMDKFNSGTLFIDEANFGDTTNKSTLAQILNGGYACDGLVTRCSGSQYEPIQFKVFGPKVIANHTYYEDPALENRMFTIHMYETKRTDIPNNLPNLPQDIEAVDLRNKLLRFRIDHLDHTDTQIRYPELDNYNSRLRETVLPLLWSQSCNHIPEHIISYLDRAKQNQEDQMMYDPTAVLASKVLEQIIKGNLEVTVNDFLFDIEQITGTPSSPKMIGMNLRSFGATASRNSKGYRFFLRNVDTNYLKKRYHL